MTWHDVAWALSFNAAGRVRLHAHVRRARDASFARPTAALQTLFLAGGFASGVAQPKGSWRLGELALSVSKAGSPPQRH